VPLLIAQGCCGHHQWLICQQAEETNGVKEVGLTHAIITGDAGEWPKAQININEVFETSHL